MADGILGPSVAQEALLGAYPALAAVLRGEHGPALQAELSVLLAQAYPERSTRKVVRVIAKMVRSVAAMDVEESVLVHDISETGISVTIPNDTHVSLAEVVTPLFVLRVESSGSDAFSQREIRLPVRLVRVVAAIDTGVVVAFCFEGVSPHDRECLYDVVQWVNPKGRRASLAPAIG